jgi:hypothetical protein
LADLFAPFETQAPPDLTVDVDTSGAAGLSGFVYEIPELISTPGGGEQLDTTSCRAWIGRGRASARILQPDEPFPTETLLKVLLAARVIDAGGLLVHGVAVENAGRAALFTGYSGAGKSTLGALCAAAGLTRLADELVAVLPTGDGRFVAHGTPWNIGQPASAPLELLGLLIHDSEHRLEDCAPSAVLRVLLSNTLLPDRSPEGRARVFQNAATLLRAVRPARLHFARDVAVATVLRDALQP